MDNENRGGTVPDQLFRDARIDHPAEARIGPGTQDDDVGWVGEFDESGDRRANDDPVLNREITVFECHLVLTQVRGRLVDREVHLVPGCRFGQRAGKVEPKRRFVQTLLIDDMNQNDGTAQRGGEPQRHRNRAFRPPGAIERNDDPLWMAEVVIRTKQQRWRRSTPGDLVGDAPEQRPPGDPTTVRGHHEDIGRFTGLDQLAGRITGSQVDRQMGFLVASRTHR